MIEGASPETKEDFERAMREVRRDWEFAASKPILKSRLSRAKSFLTGHRPAPHWRTLRPIVPDARWNAYFLYLPDGHPTPAHRYTLERLRQLPGKLLVICAAPTAADVPLFEGIADALVWKGLSGFDFSAYAIALRGIAEASPGADLFMMNDSVLGPLGDLEALLHRAPWTLTGFTATSLFENHLQSYAFFLRWVTDERVRALAPVMPRRFAFDRYRDVINLQETRFARVAARHMSVGAFWYAPPSTVDDPSLQLAEALLAAGLPFVKKSLLGRYAHFQDRERLEAALRRHGHPL